jgi:hypothetical protein
MFVLDLENTGVALDSGPCSNGGAAMAAQRWQRRWRRSNGDDGAATAMTAQKPNEFKRLLKQ